MATQGSSVKVPTLVEEFDILILGAGIAGIGAGYRLAQDMPEKSFVIIEAREELGGTWSLFKYPGIRSDSDMQTYGYSFRPWKGKKSIAPASDILEYLRQTAEEKGVDKHIRYQQRVVSLAWSSEEAKWTIVTEVGSDKERVTFKAKFVYLGAGYYDSTEGYTPEFNGKEDFKGSIIHPQAWPENFDYSNKEVVVIGSGATAVTLIPNMADKVKKITMLQRSPSYIFALPDEDKISNLLFKLLPEKVATKIIYAKNTAFLVFSYKLAQKFPKLTRKAIAASNKRLLPKGFDMKHFTPNYDPWDQRVCLVPNGDLFKVISSGKADVVTDHIDRFDATGILLTSGEHLDADVIITATGLTMKLYPGIEMLVDGKPLIMNKEVAYLGAMLTNVPNLVFGVGYTNASWTLKMELTYDLMLNVLKKLDITGASYLVIRPEPGIKLYPLQHTLTSGYLQRVVDEFPRAGDKSPWISHMSYYADRRDYHRNKDLNSPQVELHWKSENIVSQSHKGN